MNILIDSLPKEVRIDYKNYKINYDFRISILFEIMMQDDEVSERDKLLNALSLYYPVIPDNRDEAVSKILWFFKGGRDDSKVSGKEMAASESKRIYSYNYDDEYIYAAFLDQYGIDLQETDLHWWKFRALFKALRKDNEFVKIMGYRAMTISSSMSKEEQEFYKKMKRLHEIPKSKKEIKKVNDIEKALLGDGDLSKIL